jgi:transposase
MNNKENYGKKYKGRSSVLNCRSMRRLRNIISNKQISLKNVKQQLETNASLTTIRRAIKSLGCNHRKMVKQPRLTPRHCTSRLDFCRVVMNMNWSTVLFSDEKKWNIDGPDGYNYYWHDLRKEKRIYSKNLSGRNGIMVWGCVSQYGKSALGFFETNVNSIAYQDILNNYLLPFIQPNNIFQQDNAPSHSSASTINWLNVHNINTLAWPSLSPDLNIIENVWGILARRVYADGKQYRDINELIISVKREWASLSQIEISQLVVNMPHRIFKCINKNGKCIE